MALIDESVRGFYVISATHFTAPRHAAAAADRWRVGYSSSGSTLSCQRASRRREMRSSEK